MCLIRGRSGRPFHMHVEAHFLLGGGGALKEVQVLIEPFGNSHLPENEEWKFEYVEQVVSSWFALPF